MHPEHSQHATAERALTIHQPTPIVPTQAVPIVPAQTNGHVAVVQSVVLPDGRVVTGYAMEPTKPEPVALKPSISRAAVNIALGGVGFGAFCGGLLMLTAFITALAALVQQLIIFAAVIFGGFIAVQIFRGGNNGGITVNARKAVFKRNVFHG